MLVSYFPDSLKPKLLEPLPLPEVLASIREGRWAEQVQAVRALEPGSDAYADAKKKLPSFTASGSFKQRNAAGLLQHSGFLCLDIDAKDNLDVDLAAVRRKVEEDPYTYACFTTAGGVGWASLIPVPGDDHKGSFFALAAYYQQAYGVSVDQSCKDVTRLRFVSYDPHLFLNEAAQRWDDVAAAPRPKAAAPVPASSYRASARGEGYGQSGLFRATEKVRMAPDGQKHFMLNKMAYLCGGYVAAGLLSENEARQELRNAIGSREVGDLKQAYKTIDDGLSAGQTKPVFPEVLEGAVRQQLRDGGQVDAIAAGLAATQGLPHALMASVVGAIAQDRANEVSLLTFWKLVPSTTRRDAPLKLQLSPHLYRQFMAAAGFRKQPAGQKARVVRVIDQVIHEVRRHDLKDFVFDYLESLPFEFDGVFRSQLEDVVLSQHASLFEEGSTEFLPLLSGGLLRDTASQAYLCFRNGWAAVNAKGWELRPYTELPGLVWAEQVKDRELQPMTWEEAEQAEFYRFLARLAGWREGNNEAQAALVQKRVDALLLFIGYYLHGFKDPSNPRVGVLMDELGLEGQANGGTGKSLIFKAIKQLLPIVEIDGKVYDPRNTKALQQVKDSTRVIVFNDWDAHRVPFDVLFNLATDTLTVERLYTGQQSYAPEDSAKLGITTNGVLVGQGGSHDRRKYELEVAAYYGPHYQPRDEFGHNFFHGWDDAEWARFDALMLYCCQHYLATGGRLVSPVSANLERRKLLAATSAGFVDFMDAQPRGVTLYRPQLVADFRQAEGYDERTMTPHRFGDWLDRYKKFSTDFQAGQERIGEHRGQRWIILAKDSRTGAAG